MAETKLERIHFPSSFDGQPIAGYIVTCPEVKPHAILQITHGMAEYWLRYESFARYMAEHGYVVCGHDDLGHGETSGTTYPDGFFAPKNGEEYVVKDIHRMTAKIRETVPDLPLILLGHSMGSFFARWASERWPDAQGGAIYCGSSGANSSAGAGIALTSFLSAVRGPQYKSKLVDKMAFGAYLKRIPDARTPFDWLSTNEENVNRYIADPKCGFMFSVSGFHGMMKVVQHVNTDEWAAAIRKDMPVLVVSGEEDPVGNYGDGPKEIAKRLTDAGVKEVDLKLYPGMRHEILNETGKQAVWEDFLAWCDRAAAAKA